MPTCKAMNGCSTAKDGQCSEQRTGNYPKCTRCLINTHTREISGAVRVADWTFIMDQCQLDGTPPEKAVGRIISEWVKAARRLEPALEES